MLNRRDLLKVLAGAIVAPLLLAKGYFNFQKEGFIHVEFVVSEKVFRVVHRVVGTHDRIIGDNSQGVIR